MKKIIELFLISVSLIALCGCQNKKDLEADIMVVSDLHYLSPSLHDDGEIFNYLLENSDGKTFDHSEEILDTLVATAIQEDPDVLVITGDISFNGARTSHEELAERLKEIEDAGIDVLVMSGNHDLNATSLCYFGDSYDYVETINSEMFAEIYKDYGYEECEMKDPASNSFVYELNDGIWLLCLDVNYDIQCSVTSDTLKWVEEILQKAQKENVYVVSFTHQNILSHNSYFNYGYVINHNDQLLELYEKYGVDVNFSGHVHIQHVAQENDFTEILTSSASIYENHYGMIHIGSDSLSYESRQLDVEGYCREHGYTDPELLNYREYSKELFLNVNSAKATASMAEEDKEIMGLLNLYYFIGRLDEIDVDTESLADNSSFMSRIYPELGNNYNSITLDIER